MSEGGSSALGDPASVKHDSINGWTWRLDNVYGWGNLIYLDNSWPWLTETVESKTTDKGGNYCTLKMLLSCLLACIVSNDKSAAILVFFLCNSFFTVSLQDLSLYHYFSAVWPTCVFLDFHLAFFSQRFLDLWFVVFHQI